MKNKNSKAKKNTKLIKNLKKIYMKNNSIKKFYLMIFHFVKCSMIKAPNLMISKVNNNQLTYR